VSGERDNSHRWAGWRWQHLDGAIGNREVTVPRALQSDCEPVRGGRH
jgi:hypothetical protein